MPVLHEQRLIQIQRVPKFRDLAGRGAFAEHLLDGITRDNVNHQEYEGEYQPQRWKSQHEALQKMSSHSAVLNSFSALPKPVSLEASAETLKITRATRAKKRRKLP